MRPDLDGVRRLYGVRRSCTPLHNLVHWHRDQVWIECNHFVFEYTIFFIAVTAVVVDEICVRDTVNTDFMEGVLLVSSTGFAPGSIYGSTFVSVH